MRHARCRIAKRRDESRSAFKTETENTVETQTKGTSEAKIVHREGEEGKLYVDRSAVQCSAAAAEAAAVAAAKENQFCFFD